MTVIIAIKLLTTKKHRILFSSESPSQRSHTRRPHKSLWVCMFIRINSRIVRIVLQRQKSDLVGYGKYRGKGYPVICITGMYQWGLWAFMSSVIRLRR